MDRVQRHNSNRGNHPLIFSHCTFVEYMPLNWEALNFGRFWLVEKNLCTKMTSLQARSIRGGRLGSHAEEPMSLQPRRQRRTRTWSGKTLERACEGADFVSRPVASTRGPEDTFPVFRRNSKKNNQSPKKRRTLGTEDGLHLTRQIHVLLPKRHQFSWAQINSSRASVTGHSCSQLSLYPG